MNCDNSKIFTDFVSTVSEQELVVYKIIKYDSTNSMTMLYPIKQNGFFMPKCVKMLLYIENQKSESPKFQ